MHSTSRPPWPDMPVKLEDRLLEFWNLVFMQEELSAVRADHSESRRCPGWLQNHVAELAWTS